MSSRVGLSQLYSCSAYLVPIHDIRFCKPQRVTALLRRFSRASVPHAVARISVGEYIYRPHADHRGYSINAIDQSYLTVSARNWLHSIQVHGFRSGK